MDSKLMFFVDFDGTISEEDICYSMVKTYARDGWQKLNKMWEDGELSTIEVAQQTLELMDVNLQELDDFYDTINIDLTFLNFINWLKTTKYPIYILSDGYENYISKMLNKHKLNIKYYANSMFYENGLRIKAPYLNQDCQMCGVCKTSLINKYLKPGYKSVYIGDGYSDRCAVKNADYVFAKKNLKDYCENNGITYYAYDNFNDVLNTLKHLKLIS